MEGLMVGLWKALERERGLMGLAGLGVGAALGVAVNGKLLNERDKELIVGDTRESISIRKGRMGVSDVISLSFSFLPANPLAQTTSGFSQLGPQTETGSLETMRQLCTATNTQMTFPALKIWQLEITTFSYITLTVGAKTTQRQFPWVPRARCENRKQNAGSSSSPGERV